jgi:hypothetical protein
MATCVGDPPRAIAGEPVGNRLLRRCGDERR